MAYYCQVPVSWTRGRENFKLLVKECTCSETVQRKEKIEKSASRAWHTYALTITFSNSLLPRHVLPIPMNQFQLLPNKNSSTLRWLRGWWKPSRVTGVPLTLTVALSTAYWRKERRRWTTMIGGMIFFIMTIVEGVRLIKYLVPFFYSRILYVRYIPAISIILPVVRFKFQTD